MRCLIACEESQTITIEMRKLGIECFSCDITPCSGGHPEWHIQDDVLNHLDKNWDLIIAHPPCTYLTNASAVRMYPKKGQIDLMRLQKALEAKEFFMKILNAPCNRVAIENPRPLKIIDLPKETQRIQPYQFGEPYSKLTYLWLKNLPELHPTEIINDYSPYVNAGTKTSTGQYRKKKGVISGSKERSKTFKGVAKAMAEQWGEKILEGAI